MKWRILFLLLIIQVVLVSCSGAKSVDAYTYTSQPSQDTHNYNVSANQSTSSLLYIRESGIDYGAYLKWDLTALQGYCIDSGTLSLSTQTASNVAGYHLLGYRFLRDWTTAASDTTYDGSNNWESAHGRGFQTDISASPLFDITLYNYDPYTYVIPLDTSELKKMVADNMGFNLWNSGGGYLRFWSMNAATMSDRPKVTIQYSDCPSAKSVLTGSVYIDTNKNGVQDEGEIGYEGAKLTLDSGVSVITNSEGKYTFSDISHGSYTETLILPNGYKATTSDHYTLAINGNLTQNFGIVMEETANVPVIFIPGIMGSEFKNSETFYPGINNCLNTPYSYLKDDIIWLNVDTFVSIDNKLCGNYLNVLRLDAGNELYPQVKLNNSIVQATVAGLKIGYTDVIPFFEQKGYTLNKDFFIYPYDWRKNLTSVISPLDTMINSIIATSSAGTKVQIVAHSMGGLVARDYIRRTQYAQKVDTVIELGTPHVGTPTFLAHLLYDKCFTLFSSFCAINGKEINKLVQDFPGAFELLPSTGYFELYADKNEYPFNDGRNIAGLTGPLDYTQTNSLLLRLGKSHQLLDASQQYHSSLDQSYALTDPQTTDTNGVKTYVIAGSGFPTLGQIHDYTGFTTTWGDRAILPFGPDKLDADPVNGDDTVPLLSATLGKINHVYYVNQSHRDLPTGESLQMVYNLLHGKIADIPGVQAVPYNFNGKIISVHSPVLLNVYDDQGHHTGPRDDGTLEIGIPGSSFDQLEESKFIYLPNNGNYTVKTKATAQGSFDLKVKTYAASTATQSQLFLDIPQTAHTTTTLILNSIEPVLQVDSDNNGIIDQQILPTSTLTGNALADTTKPTTNVHISGTKGTNDWYISPVTLSFEAQDGESGILHTYYYKDGEKNIHDSQTPVSIKTDGTTKIWYYSVDKAGNTEQPKSVSFKIDKTQPRITLKVPQSNAMYILNSHLKADWNTQDAISGLGSVTGTVPLGNEIDTRSVGIHTFTVSATDKAGNTKNHSITYKVIYRFDGFLQPINDTVHKKDCDSECAIKLFKGGSTIPVKFQLKDANGARVQAQHLPLWLTPQKVNSISGPRDEKYATQLVSSSSSYSRDNQQYLYNWSTKGVAVGYYWLIGVKLDDEQLYTVMLGLR